METNEIKITYEDIEITYDEKENRWKFELRGRNRSAESLDKAKEYIDKPVDEKVEKPFTRIKVFVSEYNQGFKEGEVTSVAESPQYSSGKYVWVSGLATSGRYRIKKTERKKLSTMNCFAVTPENTAIVTSIRELNKQIEAIEKQKELQRVKLKHIEV